MDQNLLERVNPVFNTAKMTVFQLAAAGVGDAASVAEKLNLSFEETQNSATTTVAPEQMTANMILVETRWRTCAAIAEETGCKTLVDLPCGYTPRAKAMAQKGIAYYGLDLPAAIAEAEPAILSLIDEDQRPLVHFCGVDATNGESLKAALKDAEGPLCITTEGLLMYFTDSEVGALCDNIRMLLKEHGGCWLTADTEAGMQYILTMQPIAGDRFMEIMMQSKTTAEDKSDVNVGGNSLNVSPMGDVAENMKNAMTFLARHGLKAERMILSEHMPAIKSLEKVTPEQAQAIRQNMQKCAYWKITPMDTSVAVDAGDRFMEIMMQSKTTAEDKSDVNVGKSALIVSPRGDAAENMKNAMTFLARHGLKAERMILSEHMPAIKSLEKVTPEQAQAIRQNMQKCAYWKITPMDTSVAVDAADLSSESFDVQANVANETLNLCLKGRVDTLTAPNLLALYERIKAEHTLRAVAIDCGELAYISSAGLRVLLIMKKGSPDGVKLTGINETVREILAQTGFDSILDIAD